MNDKVPAESPIACDMSVLSLAERERHLATSRELLSYFKDQRELSNGYEFRLEGPNAITKAAEFISLEKLCCPFLGFAIEVEPEGGSVWLRLTGRDGVKAFIREEISGLLGSKRGFPISKGRMPFTSADVARIEESDAIE